LVQDFFLAARKKILLQEKKKTPVRTIILSLDIFTFNFELNGMKSFQS